MSADINRTEIEKGLTVFEKGFNWLGYLPYVSRWSGVGRMMYGELQIVTGIALFAINAPSVFLNKTSTESVSDLAGRTLIYSLHGAVNFGRGYLETLTWLGLLPIIWDLAGQRFGYDSEPRKESYPLSFDMLQKNIEWIQGQFNSLKRVFTS